MSVLFCAHKFFVGNTKKARIFCFSSVEPAFGKKTQTEPARPASDRKRFLCQAGDSHKTTLVPEWETDWKSKGRGSLPDLKKYRIFFVSVQLLYTRPGLKMALSPGRPENPFRKDREAKERCLVAPGRSSLKHHGYRIRYPFYIDGSSCGRGSGPCRFHPEQHILEPENRHCIAERFLQLSLIKKGSP